jgi:hypothetical protein
MKYQRKQLKGRNYLLWLMVSEGSVHHARKGMEEQNSSHHGRQGGERDRERENA